MERDEDRDESWGAEHFVVTFLYANGIYAYYRLFVKEYSKAPWLFLLNEHYSGDCFERDIKSNYPQFVISHRNANIWEGYKKVENVSFVCGEFRRRRDLYVFCSAT